MRTCRRCGAVLSDRVEWCGLCGSRAAASSASDLVGELTAAWSPYVPAEAPAVEQESTRPRTRPASNDRARVTAVVGGGWLLMFSWVSVTGLGPILACAYAALTLPGTILILRDAWRPRLEASRPTPRVTCAACGERRRHGARACHRCFAAYEPPFEPVFSRTAAGGLSFGPMGRWVGSHALFGLYVAGAVYAAAMGLPGFLVYSGAFGVLAVVILRGLWRRARVR